MTAVLTVSSLPMSAFAEAGGVTYDAGAAFARVEGNTAIIGNGAIERKFDFANNKVKTTEINNKRANTTLNPGDSNEEFVIKRTKKDVLVQQPIDQAGWTAKADSEEPKGENNGNCGHANHMIDNNLGTYWHSQYKDKEGHQLGDNAAKYPHFMTVSLGKPTSFKSFAYDPRDAGANGNIKGYELYVSTQETCPAIPSDEAAGAAYTGWAKVAEGEFDYSRKGNGPIHVNIKDDMLGNCENVRHVMLKATSSVNGQKFAACEEFDLYAEPWVEPEAETPMLLNASQLELDGAPTVTGTKATINKQEKTGQKLSFKFKPYKFNGATYTITENYVMYNGDHYMRKFLEISVPEKDKLAAEIDYIDLESLNMANAKNTWTIPSDQGGVVRMSVERANLGQPIYAEGMFFGCEFPAADTQIEKDSKLGRARYYTGKTMDRLAEDGQAVRANDGSIHYNTWQTVAGAARSADMGVVQADFFDYIDDISVPTEFRIQYNSWFDNMKNINDDTILNSYIEIDRELDNAEVRPLDSYVVDDGWQDSTVDAKGVWTFNNKFPQGFGPSSELVHNFGSNFGVWIGPRGGYDGTATPAMANSLIKQGKGTMAGGSIDVADRTYLEEYAKTVCDYQDRFHVNYWKWDGFADDAQYNHYQADKNARDGEPGRSTTGPTKGHMTGGKNRMYHVSDMWEAWIDLFEKVRANGEKNGIDDLWISLTTYTHPSPWFLQWANSVWLQCVPDQAGAGVSPSERSDSQMDRQLDARDAAYYDFIKENQFQFPLAHLYNHDPVYGKAGTGMTPTTATAEQFQNYLYGLAGRGTSFWELYFSDSLLDEEKYEVVSEFLGWTEENFDMLKHAKMFGSSPAPGIKLDTGVNVGNTIEQYGQGEFGTYGYAGFDGTEGILTVRNANWKTAKDLKFKFDDATVGVIGKSGDEFDYVVERHYTKNGAKSSVPEKGSFTYGSEVTLNLKPEESLTIRVTKKGAADKKSPSIETVRNNGKTKDGKLELVVRMDEKVKGEAAFTINGEKVAADKVKRSADDVTYRITLDQAPAKGEKLSVKIAGVTDMAGNALGGDTYAIDFHKDNVVASRCPSRLTTYTKKLASADKSLVSKTGFSVFSKVKTAGKGSLVKQEGAYELGIDDAGKAYLELNGVRATSKGVVNDGKEHTVVGVRENNGILKVYVDGVVSGSAYDAKNFHSETPAGDILFAGGEFDKSKDEASAKVFDRALGYNEIKSMHNEVIPDTSEKNLSKGKKVKAAWTENDQDAAKHGDSPMELAVNGDHSNSDAGYYGEFGTDDKAQSSYMEIDLGDTYELTGMHLWRYWLSSNRTYKDTLVVVSVDDKFGAKDKDNSDDVVVFNADKNNVHGFGKGTQEGYVETSDGHAFQVPAGTKGRYVRLYMNGRNDGNTNHVVEFEVKGRNLPVEQGEEIDTSALYARIDEVRDYIAAGKYTDGSIQKVMDKLEAAELVADCPKSKKDVDEALESLKGIEDLLKQGVTVSFQYVDAPEGVAAPAAVEIEEGQALGDKLPVPAAVEGYTFAGWFTDEACTKGHEFDGKTKVTANMTVFGKWVKGEAPVPPAPNPDPEDPKPGETPLTPLEPATPVKPEEKPGKKPSGDKLVQTGDNAMIGIAAAGIAGVALIGAAVVTRKRNRA